MNIDPSRPLFTRAGQYVSDYCTHVAGVAANLGVVRCGTTLWRSPRMFSARILVWTTTPSSWGPSVTLSPGSWIRVSGLPWFTTRVRLWRIGSQAGQWSSTVKMNTVSLGSAALLWYFGQPFARVGGGHEAVWCTSVQWGWCCVYFRVESVLPSNGNILGPFLCLYSYNNDCSVFSILYNT